MRRSATEQAGGVRAKTSHFLMAALFASAIASSGGAAHSEALEAPSISYAPEVTAVGDIGQAASSAEVEELLALLNDKKIGLIEHTDKLAFLYQLWLRNVEAYPSLSWKKLDAPLVRVAIADVLVHALVNRAAQLEAFDPRPELLPYLNSDDSDVVWRALIVVAMLDDEQDVAAIEAVAAQRNSGTFRAAIVALSGMCNVKAAMALDRLAKSLSGETLETLVGIRLRREEFKTRTGACG